MGFFKDLKFGGGSIGTFDNTKVDPGKMLDLTKGGIFRTDGIFAPGYSNKFLQDPVNLVKGLVVPEGGNPNSNKDPGWEPTFSIKPIELKTPGTKDLSAASKRFAPGFLPPGALAQQIVNKDKGKGAGFKSGNVGKSAEYVWSEGNEWVGQLINSHLESPYYVQFEKIFKSIKTESRMEEEKEERKVDEPFSARDYYIRFNDQNTDYFRNGLHIEGLTNLKSGKNSRESWDGGGSRFRLDTFGGTNHEQNDPVIYGFEIIFDTVNSPLLNGAVEDFISEFSYISEIASKAIVIDDFKRQFVKIFKTRGNLDAKYRQEYSAEDVLINAQRQGQALASNTDSNLSKYANSDPQSKNLYRTGKRAYMGYYLQKVDGLSGLVESNMPDKKKFVPDYGKDLIKMTFLEDLSLSLGTLAHLYKMLYWSKPNGKSLIPENLLRFNCDIIVSECRNFNRVRRITRENGIQTGIDIVKDNVSRYVYNLRECQFWFDKMSHDDSLDMGNIKVYGEGAAQYEVSFDYKYSSLKLEKWIPDPVKFGKYVGYHNGAIWKIGNKGSRKARNADGTSADGRFVTLDTSVPKFYTVNTNSQRQNGVTEEIIFESYDDFDMLEPLPIGTVSGPALTTPPTAPGAANLGEDEEDKSNKKKEKRKKKKSEGSFIQNLTQGSKDFGIKVAKGAAGFVFGEINNQISTRANILEDTINKARNLLGMGGLKNEPKRVYPRPYTPHSFGLFFDVRNELFNFLGDELAGVIAGGMNTILPGTQMNFPFKMPNIGATIHQLTGKFSLYDLEATLIGKKKAKDAKKPFFDDSKYKGNQFWGQSVNKLFNTNTKFTFPKLPDDLTFQGMALVKFGGGKGEKPGTTLPKPDFLKPKGNIFSDGNNVNALMLDKFSLPGISSGKGAQRTYIPIGTKNFNQIGFGVTKGGDAQKYPAPTTPGPQGKLFSGANTGSNLIFKYSNPSETAGRGESQIYKPIGTKDFSSIVLGNSISDPQKYPAPTSPGPKGNLYSQQNNLLQKYSFPRDFSGRGETRTGKGIGYFNYQGIGFPKSAQKYPDPIMGMNAWLQGTKGNLYSQQNNLIFKYSNPSEVTGRADAQISKPIGTKDFSRIGLGNSLFDPQKYPAPTSPGPQGKLYSAQDNLVFKYSNPSEITGRADAQISKPIGTKDFSRIGLGNSLFDPQKYPAPTSPGPKGNLYSAQDNLIFKYSNPSEITGRADAQISKPIGTKDFSRIGLGNSLFDPQKYPAPLTQNIKSVEDIVKSGTKWNYPINDKKFGK